ncbi:MAG: SET domain-containing protein [Candidatus Paceibacterota bacterium]|jgi:hypothetical protein
MKTGNSWIHPSLEVRGSKTEGKGVFAKEDIKQGERLAIFGGTVLTIDEMNKLPEQNQSHLMQIEERFVFGTTSSNPEDTDYFNHNCNPNAGFHGQIFLVAMRDIAKDEEITFDYAMIISESVGVSIPEDIDMDCHCGAPNCWKRFTENDWKIPELREKYQDYFSEYIKRKIVAEKIYLGLP